MARKKRQELSRGQQAVMAALWAAGGDATAGEVTKALAAKGRDQAYRTVQTVLGVCKEKGWVRTRKKGRKLYYLPTLGEREGIAALFADFAEQFLEGRPAGNCEAVARRLSEITVDGSSKASSDPALHAEGWKDVREELGDQRGEIRSLQHATTRLEVEVQGLRALLEQAGVAGAGGKRPRRRKTA